MSKCAYNGLGEPSMSEPTDEVLIKTLGKDAMGYRYSCTGNLIRELGAVQEPWTAWNPLTDANDMLMVIEAMRKKGIILGVIPSLDPRYWGASTWSGKGNIEIKDAPTAQRAVCLAAHAAILAMEGK